jgi:rSAM/selenodomain-associated transferase 1
VSSAPLPEGPVVAVFAKAPRPGAVKTRLVPLLGEASAARLHAALATRAVATALAAEAGPVELWCSPDEDDPLFHSLARLGAVLRRQPEGDLGVRMAHACEAAFERSRAVILIGADCPALQPDDLRDAADALRNHDAVISPAEDGGYVLLGLAREAPVFDAMPWGSAQVMARTRERLREAGRTWRELRMLWDVDRPEDYARLQQSGLLGELAA